MPPTRPLPQLFPATTPTPSLAAIPAGAVNRRRLVVLPLSRLRGRGPGGGGPANPPRLPYTLRSSGISDLWMPMAARTPSEAARMARREPGMMSPAA